MQTLTIPNSTDEALKDLMWKEPMNDKYKALIDKNIWEVVLPPPDPNIIRSCWTYVCKTNHDGATRPKSQVVAQGFMQTFGTNYDETFARLLNSCPYRLYALLKHVVIGQYTRWMSTMHM